MFQTKETVVRPDWKIVIPVVVVGLVVFFIAGVM